MATKDIYNKEFYDSQSARSYISAKEIIKILTNKVGTTGHPHEKKKESRYRL